MNINLINLLISLKNASLSKKEVVITPYNSLYIKLLKVLYTEGFIQSFSVNKNNTVNKQKLIVIKLRYSYNKPIFTKLKFFSTPSKLNYFKVKDIYKLNEKRFVLFFSTTKGFLTGLECKKHGIGGKLLFIC
jgi:ribosomal protein S8